MAIAVRCKRPRIAETRKPIAISWRAIPAKTLAASDPMLGLNAPAGVSTLTTAVEAWSDVTAITPNNTPADV